MNEVRDSSGYPMRLLLDSHALWWAICDDPKLSDVARDFILNQVHKVYFSPVSLYEIEFKAHRGRMLPEAKVLSATVRESGFEEIELTAEHLVAAARLDWSHGDPWDRILLAQATLEGLMLLSIDKIFDEQTTARLW